MKTPDGIFQVMEMHRDSICQYMGFESNDESGFPLVADDYADWYSSPDLPDFVASGISNPSYYSSFSSSSSLTFGDGKILEF